MAQEEPIVELRGVGKHFAGGVDALRGVDLRVNRGEFVSLLGPSGCGKSTLLRIIAGLSPPSTGVCHVAIGAADHASGRRAHVPAGKIGFVFQDPTLMPWSTVTGNVLLPFRIAGRVDAGARERVAGAIAAVGLGGFEEAYPHQLSGGMRMRVSVARALVTDPELLLLDEPFAALDEITRLALNDDLLRLWERHRPTILFVTHSVFESVYLSTRIAVMALARPRPYRRRPAGRPAASARARGAACARLRGHVRDSLGGAGGGDGRRRRMSRIWRLLAPVAVGAVFLGLWEGFVRFEEIPVYILPPPSAIAASLWTDGPSLLGSLLVTLRVTLAALAAAALFGGALALLFSLSRIVELSLFPYAVILQVTPIVAIAPLIIIWVHTPFLALLVCAWIVAFFPIVSNTTVGLNSADRNLLALFRLYGASRWQVLWLLRLPTALPYFLAGLRISGGLALIGAVVAEFVAGTGGSETGLAFRILEAGYRLAIPRLFAALVLLSLTGIVIYLVLDALSRRLLHRWHESVAGDDEEHS